MTVKGFEPLKHTHSILSATPLTARAYCRAFRHTELLYIHILPLSTFYTNNYLK